MKLKKEDGYYLLGLLLAWMVFFYELISQDVLFFYRDIIRYYQPLHFFAAENLQRGIFPFWNPYVSAGAPFWATSQHALLYPVNLITFLFPFFPAFKYFFLLHFLLGGVGIYLLLKSMDIKPWNCLAGALLFCYSGYLPSTINLLTTLTAAVWVGFVVLFFQYSLKSNYLWTGLVGVVLAFEFYGGQPEIMYMNVLVLVLFCLWRRPSGYVAGFSRLAAGLFVTSLLILPQLIPLRELLNLSVRDTSPAYANIAMWSMHPLELVGTLLPHFRWEFTAAKTWFRQPWLRDVYLGALPLVLMLFSFQNKQRRSWAGFFVLLGGMGLFWSLGNFTPVHYWFFKIFPVFNLIRYPIKFYLLVQLAVAVLAALGLEAVWQDGQQSNMNKRKIVALLLALGAGFLAVFLARGHWLPWLAQSYLPHLDPAGRQKLYDLYLPKILTDCFWQWLSLLGLLVVLLLRKRLAGHWGQGLICLLIGCNAAYVSFGAEPVLQTGFYRDRPQVVSFLAKNLGYQRYLFNNRIGFHPEEADKNSLTIADLISEKLPLLTQMGLPYHFFDAEAYDSIVLKKIDNFHSILMTQNNFSDSRLADMLGIRYIFTRRELRENNMGLVARMGSLNVYENKRVQPRAAVIRRILRRSSTEGTLTQIASRDFRPEVEMVADLPEAQEEANSTDVQPVPKPVRITSYDTNRVVLQTAAAQPGFLVLYDYNYPGWRATVNGVNAVINDADYIFRMVPIPAGPSEIIFTYRPTGLAWSLGAFLVLMISLTLVLARALKTSERG